MKLSVQQIQQIIPHRWPFLLVDKIEEVDPGVAAVGVKNFTINEPFFQGHFPSQPVVPGVLLIEALAQVGAVAILSLEEHRGKFVYFAGVDAFRFRQPVLPGDSVRLEVALTKMRRSMGKGTARATVAGKTVAEGELTFALAGAAEEPTEAQR